MHTLLSLILALQIANPLNGLNNGFPPASASTGCSSWPTLTGQWAGRNPANTCTSGCTGTNKVSAWAALQGTTTATQGTSAQQPAYSASAINGLAAATFSTSYLSFSTAIPIQTPTTFSWYALVYPTSATTMYMIGSGLTSSFQWGLENVSGNLKQYVVITTAGTTYTGTNTIPLNTWTVVAFTLTQSTGAYSFQEIAGGSFVSDASGTQTTTISNPEQQIGTRSATYFLGQIAEVGYNAAAIPSGIPGAIHSCYNL